MVTTKKAGANSEAADRLAGALDVPSIMKPQIVVFTVIGMSPLLQNNPAPFIGKTGDTDELTAKKVYRDEEEAALRVYHGPDGTFVHPAGAFKRAILKAVTGKKFGKASAPGVVKGAVFLTEPWCVIEGEDGRPVTTYTIDKQTVVVNKARVLRCRPSWMPWRLALALEIDTARITPAHVLSALALAGRIIGVGDFRPEVGGGFGRFNCQLRES